MMWETFSNGLSTNRKELAVNTDPIPRRFNDHWAVTFLPEKLPIMGCSRISWVQISPGLSYFCPKNCLSWAVPESAGFKDHLGCHIFAPRTAYRGLFPN